MRIPNRFKLFGRTITVEYIDDVHYTDDVHGYASFRTDRISLQPSTAQTPITRAGLEHTFLHELIHHILYAAGEDTYDPPLHKREYLVDRIAGLLHQALTTAEYDPSDTPPSTADNEIEGAIERFRVGT